MSPELVTGWGQPFRYGVGVLTVVCGGLPELICRMCYEGRVKSPAFVLYGEAITISEAACCVFPRLFYVT